MLLYLIWKTADYNIHQNYPSSSSKHTKIPTLNSVLTTCHYLSLMSAVYTPLCFTFLLSQNTMHVKSAQELRFVFVYEARSNVLPS